MATLILMLEEVGPHVADQVYSFADEKEALELVSKGSAVGPLTQKQALEYRMLKEKDQEEKPVRRVRPKPPPPPEPEDNKDSKDKK